MTNDRNKEKLLRKKNENHFYFFFTCISVAEFEFSGTEKQPKRRHEQKTSQKDAVFFSCHVIEVDSEPTPLNIRLNTQKYSGKNDCYIRLQLEASEKGQYNFYCAKE